MLIGDKELALPLIQGGMGVGVSMGGLAGAVAACGAMGTISTADVGYLEPDFSSNPFGANLRALKKEIKKAKALAKGQGLIAVNAMVATCQFNDAVQTAAAAGADAIISGAGLPLELPALVKEFPQVALAPIVSSARAAKLICRTWASRYHRTPDFVVVEGCQAGGHLGFGFEEVAEKRCQTLEEILSQVLETVRPYEDQFGRTIPVFAAGGIISGHDLAHFTKLGAAGVQMATRFITTNECDASPRYKEIILQASAKDIRLIHSPVGMPGRALNSPLVQKLAQGLRVPPYHCSRCIKNCDPAKIPFCITHALIEAVKGNWEEGLFFCGEQVDAARSILPVPQLIDELITEWRTFI